MAPLLMGAALLVGCLLAVQASVNQQLNRAMASPFSAAALQLSVATVVVAACALVTGSLGVLTEAAGVEPRWLLLGGLASPLYITAGILLFPRLGALTAVGLFVTGQLAASLALDLFGLLWLDRRPLTAGIAFGALAVLVGITVVVKGTPTSSTPSEARTAALPARSTGWLVLGVVAGAVLPVQGAVNAQVLDRIGAPTAVATTSFTVATVAMTLVLVGVLATRRAPYPQVRPLGRMPWWGWLGGLCAAVYVTASFLLIPGIGAAPTVTLTIAGQQLASGLIDHHGWLGMPRRSVTAPRSAGLVMLVVGSGLVQLA